MPTTRSALDLLRGVGLIADGPARWEERVSGRGPGVYLIELPDAPEEAPIDQAVVRAWIESTPDLLLDGERPTPHQLTQRLATFWLPRVPVLFIGQAPRSIAGRIAAQQQTPLGLRRPYSRGHWLRTLRDPGRWRLWWAETEAIEEYADALETAFVDGIDPGIAAALPEGAPVIPFGNLEVSSGGRRTHGITGALVDERPTGVGLSAGTSSGSARGVPAGKSASKRAPATRTSPTARSPRRPSTASTKPAPEPTHISREGLARLSAELEDLRVVQRPQVISRVKHARELGDLRENADYEAARNEQSFLEGRIQSLQQLIDSAVIIAGDRTGEVMLGSTVVAEVGGDEATFHIVGSTEASPGDGRISNASPVGKALMGRHAGDEVLVKLPVGEISYRIVEVR
ncbi:MAG: transcription elongation factor GreA [Chloroflexi bacterium]|nr:transcription elongation factor GreA [Chloroflexota bacterium]MDQ3408138.1 transcription elongation factor GreA [Chloroflexota bacterium]